EGYFESSQKIFIAAGKVNSISVSLKPSAAFLSVNTNADGAIIEIENVGEYENRVGNLLLAPGTYQINVYKNGYVGESKQIQLSAAGQKSAVDFQLKPLPVARLLADAQASFDRRDYDAAIKNCRQILAAEPLNPKANRLAGASYFNLTKPIDGAFLISRAVGSGEQFTFPARIFNKEKNNLQLPSGDLTVTRTALQFKSATNSSLNFYIVNKDGIELLEKTDEFGVDYISLKAKGNFGGKDDKRTVRLYAEQANVKASRKELACPKCTPAFCLCRNGRQAMFEIFSRWAKNDFTSPRAGFGAVMSPSAEFVAFQADGYALKLPENWQALVENNGQILAAPSGAYNQTQNQFEYSHGINAISLPNPNRLDLSQLTDNFLRSVIERNSYLKSSASSETNLRGRRTRVNKLSGSSPTSQRDESITIYTMTMPSNNNLLVIMTITPPDEAAEYANTFRRILNSLTFSD
ncbi:MAG: PEGA domain-containing protein, partial [Pyrinomonadaceae bacterium]|nr:PEGA domain-containing protein [Pyrinomonadaceae bacterium]